MNFEQVTTLAFDLDGTIYLGNKLIDGVLDTLNFLKERNKRILYFTNNSTKTRKEIFAKLISLGIELTESDVYTSSYAAALYIKQNQLDDFYCVGENGLKSELLTLEIRVVEPSIAMHVVIGLHREFNYNDLVNILDINYRNPSCRIIVCNADMQYPTEGGRFMPGCGAMVAATESIVEPKKIEMVGKPNDYMLNLLMQEYKITNQQIAVVGDSYSSDIAMAKKCGSPSIWFSNTDDVHKDTYTIHKFREIQNIFLTH